MKRKYFVIAMLPILLGLFALQSCTKDEGTFTTHNAFTQPVATSPVVSASGIVKFSGSTVNLAWTSENKDGEAVTWDVYFGDSDNPPKIQTGYNKQSIAVPVVDGVEYFWKVVIVDSRNVKTTSELFRFTAVNGTNPDMNVDLTVTTDVKPAIGLDLVADKVVDLRLLVLKKSDMSIVKTIDDGNANESFGDFATLADGDYVLGVDIFSTINAGDFNKAVKLSMSLQFDQLGIINTKLDFPDVMTNANPCNLYRTYLANVKKAGAVYTITSAVSFMAPAIITWAGKDDVYDSQITTTESCAGKTMTGLTFGWMLDYWGEIITSGGTLSYTISGNTITIPLQKYCKTTWKGAAQPEYSIQGSGTIDNSGAKPVWTIKYDLIQSGKTILTAANGVPLGYLEAVISPK
jgi:hypothetical protein